MGNFPDGEADFPVGGVSWYEAAAYAVWVGKELPTVYQSSQARRYYRENSYLILPRSNLGSDGPWAVGQNDAMTTLGVYDLIGNVREWCFNEAGVESRATRGGAWTDASFQTGTIPKPSFDRHATNGFRLIRAFDDDDALAALRYSVRGSSIRDYASEEPVSEAEYQVFRRLYAYDRLPLNAVVERVDTFDYMVREKVSFDLPYGERGGVALYLPKTGQRPFQAVVYWGGSQILRARAIDDEIVSWFDFFVRDGRAVAVPIFKGAYERDDSLFSITHSSIPGGWSGATYRDYTIHWVKDLMTTIDYLENRDDINGEEVGYYGFSFGGLTAPIVFALEPRIKAGITNVGGLDNMYFMPEIDPFNFVTRVRTPTLMINGRHDNVFPYETGQLPMFELLGTDPENKRHYVTEAAHMVPIDEVIRESLAWFDKYLGVPDGG